MAERVRVASIGLGWWGKELARGAVAAGMDLVSCYARTEETRKEFATALGCEPASSLEDILNDPSIQAVLIATSHQSHRQLVEAAAHAGKHVFIEKPLALSVEDARASLKAAEAGGIVLQVGFQRRRHAAHREMKRLIDDGEIGEIETLEANHSLPNRLAEGAWRWDEEESPLGSMTSLGIHQIENFHYLAGPITRVAAVSRRGRTVPIDESTAMVFEFASGAVGALVSSFFTPWRISLSVHGTEGAAFADRDGATLSYQRRGESEPAEIQLSEFDAVTDQLIEFATCIRSGSHPEVSGAEGLAVVAVLEAAQRSATSGCFEAVDAG
ncbi:MAG TPA: Gfo/Idh/MocA family oxidoreductase [Acidimicrobiia bacterium]|nr:Gfo/Idh/MocA family oxidoreductase [Acidimicrobiia bacterium]